MSDYQRTITRESSRAQADIDAGLRSHMNQTFGYMATGMLISGAVSYAMSLNPALVAQLRFSGLGWIVALAPLVMIFAFGAVARRLSANGALAFFYVIAAAIGVSFSALFLRFTGESLLTTFLTTSVAFGGMALYGYTTKSDLSGWGKYLFMALFGLIAAMIINWFVGSGTIQFAVSAIGVLLFTAFTAYDTQNIKNTYLQYRHALSADEMKKTAIFGALNLYLDFVNLFQFLLAFMGSEE